MKKGETVTAHGQKQQMHTQSWMEDFKDHLRDSRTEGRIILKRI
jgi:hypothetical protein